MKARIIFSLAAVFVLVGCAVKQPGIYRNKNIHAPRDAV